MCTAITYKTKDHYFGRNLDLEYSYKETVTVTPRNYVFDFRKMGKLESHLPWSVWRILLTDTPYIMMRQTKKA